MRTHHLGEDRETPCHVPKVVTFESAGSLINTRTLVVLEERSLFVDHLCIALLHKYTFGSRVQSVCLLQTDILCSHSVMTVIKINIKTFYIIIHITREHVLDVDFFHDCELSPVSVTCLTRTVNIIVHEPVCCMPLKTEFVVCWYYEYMFYGVRVHRPVVMMATLFWTPFLFTASEDKLFIHIDTVCLTAPVTSSSITSVTSGTSSKIELFRIVTWRKNTMTKCAADDDAVALIQSSVKSDQKTAELKTAGSMLDKKEGEQAKALFERVKKFRTHVEEADLLYVMYVLQTVLKVFKFVLIIVYSVMLVPNIQVIVICSVPRDLTGFQSFCCIYNKAHLFSKLAYTYICLVGVYGTLCIYSLYWLFHRPLKEYSFEAVRLESGINDIPDVKKDFAFLLHLSDQYDALYSKRFSAFLSEVSESRLRQVNLNHEWTTEKLRTRLTRNASERLELHVFMLPGLPDTVFELAEVEALTLELIGNVTIPDNVTQLTGLQELSCIHTTAKLQPAALNHLRENLKVLRLTFDSQDQVPLWMYTLQNLEELHLSGPLNSELSRAPTLDTLRELKNLRTLTFRSRLSKIPPSVVDVSSQLLRLCVQNEGTKLQVVSSLKKLVNLAALELTNCMLERIPSAVFSLVHLQELDLRENRLATVEEILSLQHCRRLTALRLWHNHISYIPEHISKLVTLEMLDISWNKIRRLPPRLCYCTRLRHLDLSHNQLTVLPSEISVLQSLQHLSVAFNSLEFLPDELFSCKRLKVLALGNNSISVLSPRVGNLAQLVRLELKGNRMESLPAEIADCVSLKLTALIVEESLIDLLPPDVKDKMKSP
ncbi:Volume-regulated anion channel subunit LRRC8E [Triplophysa tibetana]|uniref:Volume-regulated anion channel subunit LRRC8E n=1 Tax=Triplophysa tibetana TaxID=1572043 RepID=A0A5A9NYT4_9TELE|nr:Volume-regulated anion channel subunit LRRC8E [Triplophysa tibetana]